MRILRSPEELGRTDSQVVGFVPTMGAFHEGHLALMRAAKEACGFVVVSLFVNPTQFGPGEDLSRYPRDEARDAELAESAGVDELYIPSAAEMVGGLATRVQVGGVTARWEGERRPGHFEGVATIVAKLFLQVRPDMAFFGLKDYQQCAVVRKMVRDLAFPVELRFLETVRERDGLAMSSRNRYLEGPQRALAPQLAAHLGEAARIVGSMARSGAEEAHARVAEVAARLREKGFDVEYFALVDAETLEPYAGGGEARILAAAKLGGTRLIDNVSVLWESPPSRSV